ncbi:MAG: TetR/AcrR family transcriptional regulator [Actinomycetota bacterium]
MTNPLPEPTRRQGAETRRKLLDAASDVLATKGFEATRIDDVVAAAGVSHGTFYLYYANKEDILVALAEECTTQLSPLVAALAEVPADARGERVVRNWLTDYVAIHRSYGVVIRAWVDDFVDDERLAELGRNTLGVLATALGGRLRESHPDDAGTRLVALLALIERAPAVLANPEDRQAIDTLAAVIHRSFFATA